MLVSQDLSFSYSPTTPPITFEDVRLEAGEQMLVLGPSGSGKSTLLGLWGGLLSPRTGTLTVGGTKLSNLKGSARDNWRSTEVGLVFQRPRLLATQSMRANIALQRKLAGLPGSDSALELSLKRLDIAHVANKLPDHCSLGEQQRAGILRALAHSPTLILADEPTSALDEVNALRVGRLLKEEAERLQANLIIVTHDERLSDLFSRKLTLPPLNFMSNE